MAFASAGQLATRLGRSFSSSETSQANALLADATAYLQAEIGQLIESDSLTFTDTVDPAQTRIRLPQWPVRSVTSVEFNGTAISDYEVKDGYLFRRCGWPSSLNASYSDVEVTYEYGIVDIPADLQMWCCVLAAGAMAQAARGSLGSAGVASERIDDYAVNYETGSTAFHLPQHVLDRLRATYGQGAHVTGSA